MAIVTPTTELEAVNVMLGMMGESPVNTLEDDNVVDATVARTILAGINREIQSLGWNFNTEIGFPILRDSNNKFPVPVNTARIDTVNTIDSSSGTDFDLVLRGKFLYDRINHTFQPDTAKITVDLVVLLSFEDLPETARRYITLKAARIFQERHLGALVTETSQVDESMALAALKNDEVWAGDYNMIRDSITPVNILRRDGFDRGVY
tara:strand:- start:3030 stop:3650 length:621 start_codon:yes stop_codon:yes gene_type:complete